ncbi:probable LRR receptor-like serine/threonine-protein kinase At3g47570 [Juglans microcarpa x Juglans regia]|uniref:probable LRR receptor-like serine/threonine-protein kinase At3g47570 n=1 Tax=Juglans microcarpa x Juglans regia TaxID=2249226 RepID=UPI001B7DC4B4|nr:probable LRR receptor-like serine/threonine-protein kinase At3g47570 [Juglans microcarpa x Juglans regia]
MELRNRKFPVILIFSLSLLCLQQSSITIAGAPSYETDRLALLKFKESLSNDPHDNLRSWNNNNNNASVNNLCNWHGVTCGRKHQRVIALDLQGYALRGSISSFIGNLSFLRLINLQDNFLSGEIPQQVTRLFRLQQLILANNSLVGEIPSNLTHCSELTFISFLRNKLTGNIPVGLGSFEKLEYLNLAGNNLTGGIPASLGNVSSLQVLSLGINNFVGNIPDEIGRLNNLYFFEVIDNGLSGTVPYSLFNLSTLTTFSIGINQLHGTLPANIGITLPNLQFLSVSKNKLSGPIPVSLANASQLGLLALGQNNFVGQVPNDLGSLLDLEWLSIAENNLGSNSAKDLDFLASLGNCTKLERLYFQKNNFGGNLPNSIGNLSQLLQVLILDGNQISGIVPAPLQNLINLTLLSLAHNLFTGIIPTYFGKFRNLEALDLDGNRFSGKIDSSLGNLTQLVKLFMSQNKLEGSIPSSFGKAKSLEEFDISQNNLTGAISKGTLSSQLRVLNLSHNSLSGTLRPEEVGGLRSIYLLDVSNNNFSGEIPITIGDCLSLESLYLHHNSFQGNLPVSLNALVELKYLDLSANNLSGLIPKDLQKISLLQYLNLSFNSLEGEVPTEGVFRNATAVSVTRNKKLCGGIPELRLQACDNKVKKRGKSRASRIIIILSGVLGFIFFSSILVLYKRKKSEKKSSSILPKTDLLSKVSYKELYQVTGGFSPNNLIGSGSFGSVYKGVMGQEERSTVIAVKVLNLQQKGASKSFMAECNALRNIRHRNLVKILTCCSSIDYNGNEFKALVFEFMPNGSLEKWLHPDRGNHENESRNLNLLERLNIVMDVASALHYLHDHSEPPIIHCDLKPSNVLLDTDMTAHVSDFGLARLLSTANDANDVSQNQTSTIGIKGSIGYSAPEYGQCGEASTQGDVYSYGIFVLEIFTGKGPIDSMFQDIFNLHNYVKMALPERFVQIVDPKLLNTRDLNEIETATEEEDVIVAEEERIQIENQSQMNANMQKCLLSVFEIGVSCSLEVPEERMNMREVIRKLHRIRNTYLGTGHHG